MSTPVPDSLPRVTLNAPDGAQVEIYLQGGHVASWVTPDGHERLFLSDTSEFRPAVPIRGGVPVVFPQFSGLGPLPKHGFARLMPWQHLGTETDLAGRVSAAFRLNDSDETRRLWEHAFQLDLTVRAGGSILELRLQVTNTSAQPFSFTAALHTYLRVTDISNVMVEGLEGLVYQQFGVEGIQEPPWLHIAGEVDRVYRAVPGPIVVLDGDHTLRVTADGFPDAVVWNPGPEKAATLTDLDSYRHMLCTEAAVVNQPILLAPSATWQGTQQIEVL